MSKYIKKSDLYNELLNEKPKLQFKVYFGFKGKYHTEIFESYSNDIKLAEEKGLIHFKNDYANYLDWKPIGGASNIEGGLKKINSYKTDDKYIYALTHEKTYSLPIYLKDKVDFNNKYILFGKRVK